MGRSLDSGWLEISVIIPARDRAHVLDRALASVTRQTLTPREVIVIDDGSTDDTQIVARRYGATVLTHAEPRGAAQARNSGIEYAATPWVAFLDSDDEWSPLHLETVASYITTEVFISAMMVDSFGRARGNVSGQPIKLSPADLFFPENQVCTSAVIASREAICRAGYFRTFDRAEDLDLWIRLLEVGPAMAVPEPTVRYHVSERYNSASLETRNRAGSIVVLDSYNGSDWSTTSLRKRIEALRLWDHFRHQLRRRPLNAIQVFLELLTQPRSFPAIIAVVLHRRRQRQGHWQRYFQD